MNLNFGFSKTLNLNFPNPGYNFLLRC